LNKKNDNIHSEVILKKFNAMREEKRKESGNETEYSVVNKKLENKISEFNPEVYNLDSLESTIDISTIQNEVIDEDNEEIELLPTEGEDKKDRDKNKNNEKINLAEMMELERQKEQTKESHRENMMKKYNFDTNEKIVTYEEMENINIDDEWNKMNRNEDVDIKSLITEEKSLNEKMMEIRNKILDKGNKINNKKNNSKLSTDKGNNESTKKIINEKPNGVDPEEYKAKVENFNNFMNDNIIKCKKKKKNNFVINEKTDIQSDRINSMFEFKNDSLSIDEPLFKSISDGKVNDYILSDSVCDLNTLLEGNKIDNNNNVITDSKSVIDIKTSNKLNSYTKSLRSNETVESLLSKIYNLLPNIDLKDDELLNIEEFLKNEEFLTKKIKEKDDVGYVVHKEILYKLYNDLKEIQNARSNHKDVQKLSESMFGADLSKTDFLKVYKSKLIYDLYNSENMSELEFSYYDYLTKEKGNNTEYTANRSSILDLFEEDSDMDDDLFNKCISALKYKTYENKIKKKDQTNDKKNKKKEQLKLYRKKNNKKIKNIKKKEKRIYEEYEVSLQKRKLHKDAEKRNKEFMDKNFSDINLNEDIVQIEEMTNDYLYQKVKGIILIKILNN